jgi:hypothetical protein
MPSRGPRRLDLKFRVRPLVRMPVSVMFGKLQEFAETGLVPGDIEIAYMEYAHGKGRSYSANTRISGSELEEFNKFYKVLLAIQPQEVQVAVRKRRYGKNPAIRIGEPDASGDL